MWRIWHEGAYRRRGRLLTAVIECVHGDPALVDHALAEMLASRQVPRIFTTLPSSEYWVRLPVKKKDQPGT